MSDADLYRLSPLFRIRGEHIASVEDELGEVSVIDNKVYRMLSFDRVFEQSKMQKSQPALPVHKYICAMLMASALVPAENVLILGLGGGCLVRALYACRPQIALDVVELRQAVIDVAKTYFSLPHSDRILCQAGDAAHFIAHAERARYQLIFSDLYSASAAAPLQSSHAFLQHCAQALQPHGWLVLNHHTAPDEDSAFSAALIALFHCVLYCTTPSGNVVIYACREHCDIPLTGIRQRMKQSGVLFQSDFSLLAQKVFRWPGSRSSRPDV